MADASTQIETLTRPATDRGATSTLSQELIDAIARSLDELQTRSSSASDHLRSSMNYSLGLQGKYARGLLLLLVVDGWQGDWRSALDCARAIEMVHTASLIIDDLPAMDDAITRRGQPTNHLKFGESTAILAAIALLSDAFTNVATSPPLAADKRAEAAASLASAVGPEGMTGGQQRDLHATSGGLADVEKTHAMKTGALFAAAAEIGCIAAGVNGPRKWLMSDFGMLLGKAFQEFDDLLDKRGDATEIGKDTRKDQDTLTIVDLMGAEAAERHAIRQVALALECLEAAGAKQDELRAYVLELTRAMRTKALGKRKTA